MFELHSLDNTNKMKFMEGNIRFSLDGMLNALAKYLRALGYDCVVRRDPLEKFFTRAAEEGRIVVTLRKKIPEYHECKVITPPEESVRDQIRYLIKSIPLKPSKERLFTRCLRCNVPTVGVLLETVEDKIPVKVKEKRKKFRACPECHKIYWWGSHTDRMMNLLESCGAFDDENDFDKGVTKR